MTKIERTVRAISDLRDFYRKIRKIPPPSPRRKPKATTPDVPKKKRFFTYS